MISLVTEIIADISIKCTLHCLLHLVVLLLLCLLSPGWWCLCLGAGLGDWYLRETICTREPRSWYLHHLVWPSSMLHSSILIAKRCLHTKVNTLNRCHCTGWICIKIWLAILIPVILLVLPVLLVLGVVDPSKLPFPPGQKLSLDVCVLKDMGPRRLGPGVREHLILFTQANIIHETILFCLFLPGNRAEDESGVLAPDREQATPGNLGPTLFRRCCPVTIRVTS